jgi:hypothetical protein
LSGEGWLQKGDLDLTRIRASGAILALVLVLPAAVAGCGGDGGGSEDPNEVLEQTFNNADQLNSGVIALSLDGSAGSQARVSAKLRGPFQGVSDLSRIPQLDWTGSLDAQGLGQDTNFEGGLTVTSDNAYVTYKGQAYEVGRRAFRRLQDRFARANAQNQAQDSEGFTQVCTQAVQQGGGDTSVCDIDFSKWLTNVTNQGTENVGGTDAIHISGDANVTQILSDISGFAEQLPGASSRFDASQLGLLEPLVENATIDVYSGADDKLLRKLDLRLSLDLSALARGAAIPISNVDVSFSMAFSDLNSDQTVTAPENPKPISELGAGGPNKAYLKCIENNPSDPSKCVSRLY